MTGSSSERLARQLTAAGPALAIVFGALGIAPASAQSTPNVIVDLSVLNPTPGYAAPTYAAPPSYGAPAYAPPQGYAAPAYGVPQGYAAPQAYAAPQGYGVPQPQAYGTPQPQAYGTPPPQAYGTPRPQPYGAPPPQPYNAPAYNTAQGYGAQPGYGYVGPSYGGYLVMPNAGYGPPQRTLLAPPILAPLPGTAVAQAPQNSGPIRLTPSAPPTPIAPTMKAKVEEPIMAVPEAAPVKTTEMAVAARPEPQAEVALAEQLPTAEATAMPSEPTSEGDADPIMTAAVPATNPDPVFEPAKPKAPPAAAMAPRVEPAPIAVAEAPIAAAPAGQTQLAARTPASQSVSGDQLSISFDSNSADLDDSSHSDLDDVASQLSSDDSLRVRLVAYADGEDSEASKARRLSLSRALAVRSYLIKQGIRSTRMDVRALGNKVEGGPADRVDVVVVTR